MNKQLEFGASIAESGSIKKTVKRTKKVYKKKKKRKGKPPIASAQHSQSSYEEASPATAERFGIHYSDFQHQRKKSVNYDENGKPVRKYQANSE